MTKKMTRTALFAVAAVLVLAAICTAIALGTTSASAATLTNGSNTHEVQVTYTVAGGWTVSITDGPLALTPGTDKDIEVEVTKAVLEDNQKLSITIESENDYHLKHGSDSLAYTVKKDGTVFSSSEKTVLDNIDGNSNLAEDGKATLKVGIEQGVANQAKYVGDYTDTLNFTVNVA